MIAATPPSAAAGELAALAVPRPVAAGDFAALLDLAGPEPLVTSAKVPPAAAPPVAAPPDGGPVVAVRVEDEAVALIAQIAQPCAAAAAPPAPAAALPPSPEPPPEASRQEIDRRSGATRSSPVVRADPVAPDVAQPELHAASARPTPAPIRRDGDDAGSNVVAAASAHPTAAPIPVPVAERPAQQHRSDAAVTPMPSPMLVPQTTVAASQAAPIVDARGGAVDPGSAHPTATPVVAPLVGRPAQQQSHPAVAAATLVLETTVAAPQAAPIVDAQGDAVDPDSVRPTATPVVAPLVERPAKQDRSPAAVAATTIVPETIVAAPQTAPIVDARESAVDPGSTHPAAVPLVERPAKQDRSDAVDAVPTLVPAATLALPQAASIAPAAAPVPTTVSNLAIAAPAPNAPAPVIGQVRGPRPTGVMVAPATEEPQAMAAPARAQEYAEDSETGQVEASPPIAPHADAAIIPPAATATPPLAAPNKAPVADRDAASRIGPQAATARRAADVAAPPPPPEAEGPVVAARPTRRTSSGAPASSDPHPYATAHAAAAALDVPRAAVATPQVPAAEIRIEHQLDLARDHAWLDRLAQDIAQSAGEASRLRFALAPEHLGRLTVEIANGADGTALRLTTETEQAHRIVADAQPRLVAEARAQGLRVTDAQVDLDRRPGAQAPQHHDAPAGQASVGAGAGGQPGGERARPALPRGERRPTAPRAATADAPAVRNDLYA